MSERFVRIAVLWFVACVALGVQMGATMNFMDKPAHVHGNLLGWVSCAVFALLHKAWPRLSLSPLARAHFWLHNSGLVVMVAGLLLMVRGSALAGPLLGVGSTVILVGVVLFAIAVWRATGAQADAIKASSVSSVSASHSALS